MVGRLTAAKAQAILLERRSPAEIPVETLERFTYLIRLPVAQRLRLYPPLPLLRYAEIIE
jgi:putative ABC transport system substrate-binding protein